MSEAEKLARQIEEWENDPDNPGCWCDQLNPQEMALIIRALRSLKE